MQNPNGLFSNDYIFDVLDIQALASQLKDILRTPAVQEKGESLWRLFEDLIERDPAAALPWLDSFDHAMDTEMYPEMAWPWAETDFAGAQPYADAASGPRRSLFAVGMARSGRFCRSCGIPELGGTVRRQCLPGAALPVSADPGEPGGSGSRDRAGGGLP